MRVQSIDFGMQIDFFFEFLIHVNFLGGHSGGYTHSVTLNFVIAVLIDGGCKITNYCAINRIWSISLFNF
jgi:hypothetical protein